MATDLQKLRKVFTEINVNFIERVSPSGDFTTLYLVSEGLVAAEKAGKSPSGNQLEFGNKFFEFDNEDGKLASHP